MKKIKKIAVVGGGSAGMISALILKSRFPEIQVDIICSKKIGIIGVGEGSTEHWKEFMDHIQVDQFEMIRECNATYKVGTMFKDWGVPDYMHSIQTGYDIKSAAYPILYGKQIGEGLDSKSTQHRRYWDNKINTWFIARSKEFPTNQFHFNTLHLNAYLTKIAEQKEIDIINDEITDVNLSNNGDIESLTGQENVYEYDFYIDSTGFRKILISKLGAKWISYEKYLRTNSSMVFQTEDTEEYNVFTLSKAMKYGWLFRTPVWGRWGNGYIFDDRLLTVEQAKEEVEEYLGQEITVGNVIKFNPGRLDRVWIKNCVAIGLSASFVEPIEASSIGTTIQQTFMLMHRIIGYNDAVTEKYNRSVTEILENIRDFVRLHFICKRRDTEFWRLMAETPIPESLEKNLQLWKNKLPISEDFSGQSGYCLFQELHFLMIMHGLELFDVDKIKNEYDMLNPLLKQAAGQALEYNDVELFNNTVGISHKTMLELVRANVRDD